jgi:hypothetical protein
MQPVVCAKRAHNVLAKGLRQRLPAQTVSKGELRCVRRSGLEQASETVCINIGQLESDAIYRGDTVSVFLVMRVWVCFTR